MNEKYKLPTPLAALFAFVAFGGGFVNVFMMSIISGGVGSDPNYETPVSIIAIISLVVGVGIAVLSFRIIRAKTSPAVVFNTCFLIGLTLLGHSMWLIVFIIRTLNSDLEKIDKFYDGWMVVWYAIGPGLCMCILNSSAALLLLAFATLYDNRIARKNANPTGMT